MLNNYLIYFYQPTAASGLPTLITQGYVLAGILTVIGLIKAVGHIIDAVSDLVVASISDKCSNKNGRRIPFMKWFAVPFAVSALLIFWSPSENPLFNNIWLAVFIWAYYIFYTLYMIPHSALLPEMVRNEGRLVDTYTWHSLFFVVGSMLGYATTAIVALMKKAGLEPIMAWRMTFLCFTVIGVVLLLLPTFVIKEKAIIIMATSIIGSLVMYPIINKWSKKSGKRIPIIVGCIVFAAAEFIICFVNVIPKNNSMLVAILFALFVSLPFAVLNILPGSMMADVIRYDTVKTGINQEGTFAAAKSFVTKLGTSIATMIVPSLVIVGAVSGESIGQKGLLLTAIVGGLFTLAAVIVFAVYNEKEVLTTIRAAREEK